MKRNSRRRQEKKLVVTYQEVTKDEQETPVGLPCKTEVWGDVEDNDLHLRAAQCAANTLFVNVISVVVAVSQD